MNALGSTVAPSFCTGYGRKDTHSETLSDGRPNSHPKAGHPYEKVTGKEIIALVKEPPKVPKDKAQWFIPSSYAGADARSHEAQHTHGEFFWLAADIDKGNPSLGEVKAALDAVLGDAGYIVYSSRSSKAEDRRWRVLVPLQAAIAGQDYRDTAAAFFDLLEAQGLVCDRALERPGQLIYLPNRGEHYEYEIRRGRRAHLDADHEISLRREEVRERRKRAKAEAQAERDRKATERARRADHGEQSPVDHFNEHHTVEQLLGRYGYEQLGHSRDWRSPMQTSGSYATRAYEDYWVSLSASDAAAGVGRETKDGHRHGDAFDLFVHFEHAGDFNAAVRAYAEQAGLSCAPPLTKDVSATDSRGSEAVSTTRTVAEDSGPLFPSATRWVGKLVPEREWLVDPLIPSGQVTMLGGPPGSGKSLLALQLAISTVLGEPWVGNSLKRVGPAVYLSAEDDEDELHRRVAGICHTEKLDLADLGNLFIRSLADGSALLAEPEPGRNVLRPTRLFDHLRDAIATIRPSLVVLDTLADLHAGNENDRVHARQVIGLMRTLAVDFQCAVVVLAHPSLTGTSTGTGLSGSTGWEGSVRSRLYLDRVRGSKGSEVDPDERVLSLKKSNYARADEQIRLVYISGRFIHMRSTISSDAAAKQEKADRVFLKLLDELTEQGRRVKAAKANGYAPKVFVETGRAEGLSKADLHAAMERLLARKVIREEKGGTGPPSKRTTRLVRVGTGPVKDAD